LKKYGKIKDRISDTNLYVYVLALETNKFHDGIATDPIKRFEQHKAQEKDCASFCTKCKAKELIKIIDTGTKNMIEACKLEDKITIQYEQI